MKNKIFVILLFVLVWIGCDKREIPMYNTGKHCIEFEKATVDSTIFTFIYYPYNEYYDLPVAMKIAGDAADKDLVYKFYVDEELSTADAKHYALPETTVIRKGFFHDTCYIRLNKTKDLDGKKVKLVLRLEATSDCLVGKLENSVAIIQFSNTIDRPAWWDSKVEQYYLGSYSQKKFVLFLRVTEADLTGTNDSEKRTYALEFKQYLIDHRGEPETIDEDGQPMSVPVLGLE